MTMVRTTSREVELTFILHFGSNAFYLYMITRTALAAPLVMRMYGVWLPLGFIRTLHYLYGRMYDF